MRYIKIEKSKNANDLLARTYRQIKKEALPVPPLTVHSVIPESFAANWCAFREIFLVDTHVERKIKEAVNAAISKKNACPYCVNVHTLMLKTLKEKEVAKAIEENSPSSIKDEKIRNVVEWAFNTTNFNSKWHVSPPFSKNEAPEIMGAALQFHMTNRLVNVFLEGEFYPLSFGRGIMGWFLSKGMKTSGMVGKSLEPGLSLQLIDDDKGNYDGFAWAKPNAIIHRVLLYQSRVIENAAADIISPAVKEVFNTELNNWDGEDKEISRAWLEKPIEHLSSTDKIVARIVLLTAFASYQLDEKLVEAFSLVGPTPKKLFATVVWSAFNVSSFIVNKTNILQKKIIIKSTN